MKKQSPKKQKTTTNKGKKYEKPLSLYGIDIEKLLSLVLNKNKQG